ncbi:urocortin 3, like [Ictalurus furcatus]|uniref:urocortin 3, like n=1 Tax=Ictalurus furcatus TaxID=66913 RepID=UPI0023509E8B|nr:urocortin 3, like [Ictalurus furcatus]
MQPMRTLLVVLAVLCTPVSSLCLRAYDSDSGFLCDGELLPSANSDEERVVNAPHDSEESSEELRERRTLPGSSYKFLSHTLLRSKMYGNGARSDRRSRVTLSLDVPTNLMNALFDIARAKNLRAKAAHNARLMAQIGKRR